ncbi:hypothetical protein [Streptomyces cinereoruber]|uniref:hypothetical protein n=1 Tax=Streptomyces cinereoruber TaxID=67260 RepID=UPI003C2F54BC
MPSSRASTAWARPPTPPCPKSTPLSPGPTATSSGGAGSVALDLETEHTCRTILVRLTDHAEPTLTEQA